jgi:hypothetical protein
MNRKELRSYQCSQRELMYPPDPARTSLIAATLNVTLIHDFNVSLRSCCVDVLGRGL